MSSHPSFLVRSVLALSCASVAAGTWSSRAASAQPTATPAAPVAGDPATAAPPPAVPPAAEPVATPETPPAPEPVPAEQVPAEPKAEPKKDEKPALKATYDKGLVFATEDGKFEAKLALRTQFRLEIARPLDGVDEFQSRFLIARSRLQLEGHVYGKDNRYKVELGLNDGGSFSFVKDAYIEHKVSSVWIRVGQAKRPFNRQEMVSDFASTFNERAVTNDFIGGGRSLGLSIHNDYEKSPEGLEWAFGVFNSFSGGSDRPTQTTATTCTTDPVTFAVKCTSTTSRPGNVPTDFGPTLVARVGWNVGKIKGYSEGDLEGGPLRLAVAASYKVDLANFAEGAQSSKPDNFSHGAELDAILKNEGLDVLAGVYLQKLPGADAQYGALLQGGFFVTPKELQLGARFAIHEATGTRKQLEGRVAVNYYLAGHALKLATDYGFLQLTGKDGAGVEDKADLQARVMAQLTF